METHNYKTWNTCAERAFRKCQQFIQLNATPSVGVRCRMDVLFKEEKFLRSFQTKAFEKQLKKLHEPENRRRVLLYLKQKKRYKLVPHRYSLKFPDFWQLSVGFDNFLLDSDAKIVRSSVSESIFCWSRVMKQRYEKMFERKTEGLWNRHSSVRWKTLSKLSEVQMLWKRSMLIPKLQLFLRVEHDPVLKSFARKLLNTFQRTVDEPFWMRHHLIPLEKSTQKTKKVTLR